VVDRKNWFDFGQRPVDRLCYFLETDFGIGCRLDSEIEPEDMLATGYTVAVVGCSPVLGGQSKSDINHYATEPGPGHGAKFLGWLSSEANQEDIQN
jgi:hypothetical protein